jgi:hypothetical protein
MLGSSKKNQKNSALGGAIFVCGFVADPAKSLRMRKLFT